jgi:hypothetical protein
MQGAGSNPEAGLFFWVAQDDKLNADACVYVTHAFGTRFECYKAEIR